MENQKLQILTEELKKHKLCRLYWSDQVEKVLSEDLELAYEPVGDMGIYSKYLNFDLPYCGESEQLAGSSARMRIGISSNGQRYDIQKAIAGTDCFHNVRIEVKQGKKTLCICKFRLWDDKDEEYCGDQLIITLLQSL